MQSKTHMKHLIKYDSLNDFYSHEGGVITFSGIYVISYNEGETVSSTYKLVYDGAQKKPISLSLQEGSGPSSTVPVESSAVELMDGDYLVLSAVPRGFSVIDVFTPTNVTGTSSFTMDEGVWVIDYEVLEPKTGQGTRYAIKKITVNGQVFGEFKDGAMIVSAVTQDSMTGDIGLAIDYGRADNDLFVTSIVPGVSAVDIDEKPVFYNKIYKPISVTVVSYMSGGQPVTSTTYTSTKASLAELITPVFNNEPEHVYRTYTFTDENQTYTCVAETSTNINTVEDAVMQIKTRVYSWPYYDFVKEEFTDQADGMVLEIRDHSNRPT